MSLCADCAAVTGDQWSVRKAGSRLSAADSKYWVISILGFAALPKISGNKKGRANTGPTLSYLFTITCSYFLNLRNPASPITPKPRRSIVAGSGTWFVSAVETRMKAGVPPSALEKVKPE
jgi:hypothetical protein